MLGLCEGLASSRLRLGRLGLGVATRGGGDCGAAEVRVVGHHLVLLVRPLVDKGLNVVVGLEGLDGL